MSNKRQDGRRPRSGRRRLFPIEVLEARALLTAAETFSGPSLSALIQLAGRGENTAPAAIKEMLGALQTQLDNGPLADLNSGAVNGNGFVAEVQSLETSFEQNVDQQLASVAPHVDELLKLQGQQVVANVVSLNQQAAVGLLSSSQLATQAQAAINTLTSGPIASLGTPPSAYVSATQGLESSLNTLAQSLSSTASPTLTASQVSTTVAAEAEAYRAEMHAGLQVTHPYISNMVDSAVNALESTAAAIAQDSSAAAQSQLSSAITAFDDALLDTTGLFGPQGVISQALSSGHALTANLTVSQSATTLSAVSGTATSGGTATLTATLTSTSGGQGLAGKTVDFTLDGAFVGAAVTNSSGVATLTGVTTSDAAGVDSGGVVASFAGDLHDEPSHASGDLTVSQASTNLSAVSGTATSGTATLTATLTSAVTGQGIPNETVSFTLDGTSVGTAVTDSSGVATLTGVSTSDAVGTDSGGVVASFAGDTNYAAASNTSGNLIVS